MSESRQCRGARRVTMPFVLEDFDACYRAVASRDARFDGWFFTAVTSTGIYCRPSCPATTPKPKHVRFFSTAGAAQAAGFRACLRCRPDATPGSPEWLGRSDVAARAMRLIADGTVENEGVEGLAGRLGYSTRQLHRVLVSELGTGATSLARAHRAQSARTLLETTELTVTDVAFAAGFDSVRQFNDTVRQVFARTPSELRTRSRSPRAPRETSPLGQRLTVRLAHRHPFCAEELFSFLGARAIPGLEVGDATSFARTLRLDHGPASVILGVDQDRASVRASFELSDLRDLTTALSRCRQLLNLDADPVGIDQALGADSLLGPLVARRPGLRVPGGVEGFETAVCTVVGQGVSLPAARTLLEALVDAAGQPVAGDGQPLRRLFPTPAGLSEVLERPATTAGLPASRRRALLALCRAVDHEGLHIDPGSRADDLEAALLALPGIGPWTAAMVTMRALGHPDVFLDGDLGVVRALGALGCPGDRRALAALAQRWRPWRSYAVMHLWASGSRRRAPVRQVMAEHRSAEATRGDSAA